MSTRFDILDTPLAGLRILQRKFIGDSRGYLERLFCSEELQALAPGRHITQINHTLTATRGTVRGMHFQRPPHAEIKFVSCLRGEVFDVAVDLRDNSPTFLRWHAEVLSADNHKTLVIPEGFAHGFQTLTDNCEMLYFHTAAYQPGAEGGLNAQDPRLAIQWPLPVAGLSPRDAAQPLLDKSFTGVAP
ncbi:MAG: dTDP-4-dehydrorhamnose 3,5-epimerase [Gammaproteobacteria bacterium]|nr:dTDP-4-keto-6-deoxy-D-glucose epimerase [Rhodocyclaceae bacterium]MBU3910525.1 dTDP-4-dehydrorhamnose 3,5-epimerase [Gammaproteobacteria bacterium]MBU3989056.1 dTDP-4-dehydrorhamnose 3,5-epimerase [Gammaproteobacteria bacterium]MBU4005006.1 dTDP-4-dehydrorhamnose 3,5-epimerase [Gammaproteobacteria bacterium]MBU4020599.1 dTDP-4-dehydrorhamnose 3,5-epimerase [Gammaproteobacteria bacterium]